MFERLLSPEIGLIFWQTISILLVGYLLKLFAWKQLLAFIEEEERKAIQAAHDAQKVHESVTKLQKMREQIIAKATKKHDDIIKEAQKTKEALLEEANIQATEVKAKKIEEINQTMRKKETALRNKIKKEAAALVVSVAQKVIKLEMQQKQQRQAVINQYIQETEQATQNKN